MNPTRVLPPPHKGSFHSMQLGHRNARQGLLVQLYSALSSISIIVGVGAKEA